MKKLYTLLIIAFAFLSGNAQIVSIPDANFKAKLVNASFMNYVASTQTPSPDGSVSMYTNIDTNNDGEIQVTEALAIKWLDVNSCSITDLTGIQSFTNLQFLRCDYNELTNLNVSGLTNLRRLFCTNNQLLDVNLSGLTNLQYLDLTTNVLTGINLNGLDNLQTLSCIGNQLQSIDVNGLSNLINLKCNGNQLSNLNVALTHLNSLWCQNNQLTNLNVSGSTSLVDLDCHSNFLQTLDISALTHAVVLNCGYNHLTSLFLKNGFNDYYTFGSNPNLHYICADDNEVSQLTAAVTSYQYNCIVNSYCSFVPGGNYYTVQGNTHFDSNLNGCDATDFNVLTQSYTLTNGTISNSFISNTGLGFSVPVSSGTYTITPVLENPGYFNITPASATVTIPTSTSPFSENFCVTANGTHNDVSVVVIPIRAAIPGFNAVYKIIYKNKGTNMQSGVVSFTFDDTRLDYVSAMPLVDNQTLNSLSWNYVNLNPLETREIILILNLNSPLEIPAINSGDVLHYTSTIIGGADEMSSDNSFTLNQIVRNSHDPNNKTCVEGTTLSSSQVGEYVHYVICFENTGTANAQNIVVKDMIDTTKYEISSLAPLSGSAPFFTRIVNTNQAEFIFENINLPFDDANNDGYVAFKIKTKPSLVVGDTFSNTANIYFDYNFPIITNTATTTVQALGISDFDFGSTFSLSPVPAKNILNITSKQNVEISSVSIYNTLGQLVRVNTGSDKTIDVAALKTGTYFIKITSDKGTASGKFIKE